MKSITRFAEYSCTGLAFWLAMLVFLTLLFANTLNETVTLWHGWITGYIKPFAGLNLPSELMPVLGLIGLVIIFLTGLILDLINPGIITYFEMRHFQQRLRQNSAWMEKLFLENSEFLGSTYHQFIDLPLKEKEQRKRFRKLRVFVINYVMINAHDTLPQELVDRMRLWRITRSFSTCMMILALLISLIFFLNTGSVKEGFMWLSLPYLLVAAAIYTVLGAFENLCDSLTAILYHLEQKEAKGGNQTVCRPMTLAAE